MTVLMVPVLFGATLVSTDTAVLVNAEAQLKTAADASALAGAMALADDSRLSGTSNLGTLMASSRGKAIAVAGKNLVLGAAPVVVDNPSNGTTGDVVIGYLAPSDTSSSPPSTGGLQALFNAVKVSATRDASHGGQVPTFFGGPLGIGGKNLTVSSTAMAQNYTIKGFKNFNNQNLNILPIVLDKPTYDAMVARTTADQYAYNPTTKTVSPGADGVPESQLYPTGTGSPGNWGTVKVGVSDNGTATLASQIQSGITPDQLATFPGGVIQLDPAQNPPSITFGGNPGLSAGIQDALTSIIGQTATIGIYDQTVGSGNNSTYRVVSFATVRVMAVNFQGNPKYVMVQPTLTKDATAIPGDPQPSWTYGGLVRVHLAR